MRWFRLLFLISATLGIASASGAAAVSADVPKPADPQRIAEIAARLPERPAWPIAHVRPDPRLLPSCRRKTLTALASDAYFSTGDEIGHFLLKHGVGNKPCGREVDTPLDYGDYYFLEGLLRL